MVKTKRSGIYLKHNRDPNYGAIFEAGNSIIHTDSSVRLDFELMLTSVYMLRVNIITCRCSAGTKFIMFCFAFCPLSIGKIRVCTNIYIILKYYTKVTI